MIKLADVCRVQPLMAWPARTPWDGSTLTDQRRKTRDIHPMLGQRWASVEDAGPTLTQHWVHPSCLYTEISVSVTVWSRERDTGDTSESCLGCTGGRIVAAAIISLNTPKWGREPRAAVGATACLAGAFGSVYRSGFSVSMKHFVTKIEYCILF